MVYIHMAEGFEEIETLTQFDLLKRARVDVKIVSVTGHLAVKGSRGSEVVADILFEDADYDDCEMIVLPGGMPGSQNLADHEKLMEKVYSFANEGKFVAAICAAPALVLGEHGVLNGKKATCYPGMENHMKGAIPTEGNVVRDNNIITSKGPATAMEFGLALIEALKGKEKRDKIAEDLLF
jgi:4-methyl-5(b-hydroxyethyl)-thiazole monophosphate biosynthesis